MAAARTKKKATTPGRQKDGGKPKARYEDTTEEKFLTTMVSMIAFPVRH